MGAPGSAEVLERVLSGRQHDGLGVGNGRGAVSITNSRVTGNAGGGVSSLHNVMRITDSLIARNTGLGGISTGDGGAFISNSVIEDNTADGTGGGVSSFGQVRITGATISGNTAT